MKPVHLRLPDDLHDRIAVEAERDRRSVHAEILWLIEQALGEES